MLGQTFFRGGEICSSCHNQQPTAEQLTLVDGRAEDYARNLLVIRNKAECFSCHASHQTINGTLVVDLPMTQARARLRSDMVDMLLLGGIMLGITILVLGILIDRMIVRRVKAVERATVAIRGGNLDERVAGTGRDEISDLASGLNVMAASLKSSVEQIERHKNYLEKVINSIEDEIVVVDRRFRIVTANRAFLRGTGQPKDALIGRSCRSASPDTGCQSEMRQRCPAKATFQTGTVEKCLHRSSTQEGRDRFLEIHSYPLTDDQGKVFQAIEVRRDITERRALEANLCHSDRLVSLGLLASGISHEINNPLASIVASSEGLVRRLNRRKPVAEDEQAAEIVEYLDLITKEAMRAKAITERLLILSRKSDSRAYLLSVNKSLAETIRLVEFQANNKGITVSEQYGTDLSEIKADDPALRQVFLNLLLNAIQSTGRGGEVAARTRTQDGTILIEIADTGCGISPEELPYLFDPFYSRTTHGNGTGLGLFISNTLVRQMGGELFVSSRVGAGSTFTVALPSHNPAAGGAGFGEYRETAEEGFSG
jgi:PAS domain S-box-containing protein